MPAPKKRDVDDDDDKGAAAEARDAAKMKALNDKPSEVLDSEDKGPIEIDLDEPDKDDDEPDELTPRRKARAQRGRDLVQEARDEAAAARREAQQAREEAAAARASVTARNEPKTEDPADAEMGRARSDQASLQLRYQNAKASGKMTQADVDGFEKEWQSIEDRKLAAAVKKYAGSNQKQQSSPDEIIKEMNRRQVVAKHSDVVSNGTYLAWAQGRLQQYVAERGQQADTPELVDQVMAETRRKFGLTPLGGPTGPDRAQQSRLSGLPRGGGSGTRDTGSRTITMTKEYRALADASYSHIKDKAERYKKWAQTTGKKIVERDQG